MNTHREHIIEALLVFAVAALLHLPDTDAVDSSASLHRASTAIETATAERIERTDGMAAAVENDSLRIDPLGLLQSGVPAHWRVELPTAAPERTMTC